MGIKITLVARRAAWYAANRAKVCAKQAAWRARNPGYAAAQYAADPEKAKAAAAAWFIKNRARARANNQKWHAANPDSRRVREQNRRARKKENGGQLSPGIVAVLYAAQRGGCAACDRGLRWHGYHLDHCLPLALGGKNEDSNMQLLCPPCNLSKGAKHPDEYMPGVMFLREMQKALK